jgi:hypothetical protein
MFLLEGLVTRIVRGLVQLCDAAEDQPRRQFGEGSATKALKPGIPVGISSDEPGGEIADASPMQLAPPAASANAVPTDIRVRAAASTAARRWRPAAVGLRT